MEHASLLRDPEIWVLVSFVLFFVLFGGKLWAALAGMLDKRAALVSAELAEAQRLRLEAQTMLAEANDARETALIEARDMLSRSHAEAQRLGEAAVADAEASAKRRERLALERISAAEKAAVSELRNATVDLATKAAAAVIGQGLGHDAEAALVDNAIAGLPRALRAA